MSVFASPVDLGLPPKFQAWGPGQRRAFEQVLAALTGPKRFVVLSAPTGYGKSIIYMAARKALSLMVLGDNEIDPDADQSNRFRCAIVTASKGLQDQNQFNFGQPQWDGWDVRGQGNYTCTDHANVKCDVGKHFCRAGVSCSYQVAYRGACDSDLPMTNYAYWLAVAKSSMLGLGERRNLKQVQDAKMFDLLVLDEGHEAEQFLSSSLHVEIVPDDLVGNGGLLGWKHWPVDLIPDLTTDQWDNMAWSSWASGIAMHVMPVQEKLEETLASAKATRSIGNLPSSFFSRYYKINKLMEDLEALAANVNENNRVVEVEERRGTHQSYRVITSDVVSPSKYAERFLFRKIPKVLITSATITMANVKALGIDDKDLTFIDLPSIFDMRRAPIWSVNGARMNFHIAEEDVRDEDGGIRPGMRSWLRTIDRIVSLYPNAKGVIHTSSYKLQQYIVANSRHSLRILANDKANTAHTVDTFKTTTKPLVLVSPSITTGYDFADDECRFVIIAKLPLQQVRSRITKARLARNPSYIDCQVAQEIVQAAGRGMRGSKDWCATYIVDDQIRWFFSKNRRLFPRWFEVAHTGDNALLLTPSDFK